VETGPGADVFDGSVRASARNPGPFNREIANTCSSVYLVVAGLAQKLK
jgi:adenosylcobinamide kinase/adenosylcobinamide-phosphate guanylyltransferase